MDLEQVYDGLLWDNLPRHGKALVLAPEVGKSSDCMDVFAGELDQAVLRPVYKCLYIYTHKHSLLYGLKYISRIYFGRFGSAGSTLGGLEPQGFLHDNARRPPLTDDTTHQAVTATWLQGLWPLQPGVQGKPEVKVWGNLNSAMESTG